MLVEWWKKWEHLLFGNNEPMFISLFHSLVFFCRPNVCCITINDMHYLSIWVFFRINNTTKVFIFVIFHLVIPHFNFEMQTKKVDYLFLKLELEMNWGKIMLRIRLLQSHSSRYWNIICVIYFSNFPIAHIVFVLYFIFCNKNSA